MPLLLSELQNHTQFCADFGEQVTGYVVVTVSGVPSNGIKFRVTSGYTYFRAITIDHTKVPNTDQTNFPVLISGTYPYLATTANGGNVTSANGYDIIFSPDAAGTSILDFEQESYSPSTGAINYWVRVPTLSHSTDTIIYMFYGNSLVSTDQSNKGGVWDSNYALVSHLADNAANMAVADSTSNVNNLTNQANTTNKTATGKISNGLMYNGSSDYSIVSNNPSLNIQGSSITLDVWAKPTNSTAASSERLIVKEVTGNTDPYVRYGLFRATSGSAQITFWISTAGSGSYTYINGGSMSAGTWTHAAGVYNGSTMTLYINGSPVATSSKTGNIGSSSTPLVLGADTESSIEYFNGVLDEARISNIARSADWIATEYNSQGSPSTFYSLGSAGSGNAGSPRIIGLSPTSGLAGTSVTITGSNFGSVQGSSTLAFNGTIATATSWSASQVVVAVPSGVTSGNVVVTVSGVASNGLNFSVAPNITNLSPASGAVSSSVTITGTTFGATQGSSTVTFNGVSASPTSWSATSVVVPVPAGATTGNVVVFASGVNSSGVSFTVVPAPSITSLSIATGAVGAAVTITGTSFGSSQGSGTVKFNGITASVTSWSPTSIVVTVPTGATTGNVVVFASGVNSNGVSFTVVPAPSITSLSPSSAPVGGSVKVNGASFGTLQGSGQVKFGSLVASVTSWSATSITATVPSSATTGPVTVSASGVISNSAQFTLIEAVSVTSISPTTGLIGSSLTINGTGFGPSPSNSVVALNTAPIVATTSWTDTQIVAIVPLSASPGVVSVTVAGITAQGPTFVPTSKAQVTDSLGNSSTYAGAVKGGLWRPTDSQGSGCSSCTVRGTIHYAYDAWGNATSTTDSLGHVTTDTFDTANHLTSELVRIDTNTTATTSYTYNSFAEPLTVTDPLGHVTTNVYDSHGNLTSVTSPAPNGSTAASVTRFAYDLKGELTSITDPLNHVTTMTYTTAGLIATITDAQNNVTSYQYDPHGNRTRVTDVTCSPKSAQN